MKIVSQKVLSSPLKGVEGDGSRFVEVVLKERLLHGAVHVGHPHGVLPLVRPVQVAVDPVRGQSVGVQAVGHELRRQAVGLDGGAGKDKNRHV